MAENRPGGEPTEEPTPRRLEQARRQGQIAKSNELTSAVALAAGVGALLAFGPGLMAQLADLVRAHVVWATSPDATATSTLGRVVYDVLYLTLPVLGTAAGLALVCGALQARGLLVLKPLLPSGERISPLAGFRRLFALTTLGATLWSLVKLVVIGAVVYVTIAARLPELARLSQLRAREAFLWLTGVAATLAWRVALSYLLLGGADFLWQRYRHRKELRMTREEVKREHKDVEGDPRHKAERQRLHRDLLRHRMVEAVRTADCVIVNPDHIAVALKFDEGTMSAPQVVAKGERRIAEQIKDVARQFGVPVYRDVALARSLCELELGDEIPEALYDAVAEILRFVYRQAEEGTP
jgi:FlhB-like protein